MNPASSYKQLAKSAEQRQSSGPFPLPLLTCLFGLKVCTQCARRCELPPDQLLFGSRLGSCSSCKHVSTVCPFGDLADLTSRMHARLCTTKAWRLWRSTANPLFALKGFMPCSSSKGAQVTIHASAVCLLRRSKLSNDAAPRLPCRLLPLPLDERPVVFRNSQLPIAVCQRFYAFALCLTALLLAPREANAPCVAGFTTVVQPGVPTVSNFSVCSLSEKAGAACAPALRPS